MNYYVICPWAETGGPEALHQLCSTLNDIGENAFIYYHDGTNNFSQINRGQVIEKYSQYNIKTCDVGSIELLDSIENVIVIPEVFPIKVIEHFKNCKIIFWRLCIFTHGQELTEQFFQKVYHGCQNDTQFNILKESNLFNPKKYFMLTDYTNESYIIEEDQLSTNRKRKILYNPRKGLKHSRIIIDKLSGKDIEIVPIVGMTNEQIKKNILESKVYIDFGDHPGKDRIPRECAIGGCVVITGTQRCGANQIDIPINTKFEYNEYMDSYNYDEISEFVLNVLDNYAYYFKDQESYRDIIRKEKETFKNEVIDMINIVTGGL